MDYTAKNITIINHTFSAINTWELVVSKDTSIRKWFLKSREDDTRDTKFDYAFVSSPTTYMTNGGQGSAFDGVALPNIYARVSDINIQLELVYFD